MTAMNRRSLLQKAAAGGGAFMTAGVLDRLNTRNAAAATLKHPKKGKGYGPPVRQRDQFGREILALPPEFDYITFGDIGSPMSDGNATPVAHDGMRCFRWHGHKVRLIRNQEDRATPGAGSVLGPADTRYDKLGGGGTTTLEFDLKSRKFTRDFISLNGTTVNCAGGASFRETGWITGEEVVIGPAQGWEQNHGYQFLVPLDREGPEYTEPLRAMGRFAHEACAVDQRTGIVYQTEDPGSGVGAGLYRFLPKDRRDLSEGGRLQILARKRRPQYDARENQVLYAEFATEWIDIEDPDPADATLSTVFNEGFAKGAVKFNRLEGCWYERGSVFFASTSGGGTSAGAGKNGDVNSDGFKEGWGQIWELRTGHGRHDSGSLRLIFESGEGAVLDGPDNICVTPRGGLILCEDDPSTAYDATDTHPAAPGITNVNRLIGVTEDGASFEFAVNILNDAEFAGACFSPDGEILFVNVFGDGTPGSGMTCAIWGPWRKGPL